MLIWRWVELKGSTVAIMLNYCSHPPCSKLTELSSRSRWNQQQKIDHKLDRFNSSMFIEDPVNLPPPPKFNIYPRHQGERNGFIVGSWPPAAHRTCNKYLFCFIIHAKIRVSQRCDEWGSGWECMCQGKLQRRARVFHSLHS